MSFNGAGVYSLPSNSFAQAVTGTTISSSGWNSTGADIATALSTCVLKDGQQTTTALVPFAAGISISGINAEDKKRSVYKYTAWDPSDVAGTYTNASNSSSATSAATSYITVTNTTGTTTWVCVKAGAYKFTVTGENEMATNLTAGYLRATIGGTGTIVLPGASATIVYPMSYSGSAFGSGTPWSGEISFTAILTAAQTVTVLPALSVTSGGVTTNFTQQCTVSAEYTGTN